MLFIFKKREGDNTLMCCAETGKIVKPGERYVYDTCTKKTYCCGSVLCQNTINSRIAEITPTLSYYETTTC